MNLFDKKQAWILGGFEYLHADNVTADPGAGGATFRSDDVGAGVQVPYAKLMDGTDGSSAVIPGDATNGLYVNVTKHVPGTGATNLGKAEDAAHTSGDVGVMSLAVRNDTRGSLSSADGDYTPFQLNASGDLRVDGSAVTQPVSDGGGTLSVDDAGGTLTVDAPVGTPVFVRLSDGAAAISTLPVSLATVPSHAVTNAGTFAVQESGSALTALQLIDNIVAVEDAAASGGESGVPVLAVRRDSASSGVSADGDFANLSVDANGALRVTGGGGGTQYAEDTAHASGDTGTLALAVRRDTAASGTSADGDYGTLNTDASGRLWVNASGAAIPITDNSGSISVDDNGGALTVDNGGTFAVQVDGAALTSLQLLDDTVFAEDVAAQAGDKGIQVLAVRRDANTSLVGADNDYAPLQVDASGSLKVAITAGAGSGGTSIADDAAFTPASTSITPVGGTYRSTLDAVDDGDAGAFAMTANRAMHVNLRDASGNELSAGAQYAEDAAHASGDLGTMSLAVRKDTAASTAGADGDYQPLITNSAGKLWVDASGQTLTVGSHAVTNAGTFATQVDGAALTALQLIDDVVIAEDAAHASGDKGVMGLAVRTDTPANRSGADGDYEPLQVSAGRLWTSTTVTSLPASTNTIEVVGDAAHDAAVAGNPVRAGGRARTSDYTAVANDDTADFITDLNGKQIVLPYAIPENAVSGAITSAMTGTTSTSLVAAPGAGLRNYLTTIIVSNSHATQGTDVIIQDGSGGTTLMTIPAAAVYGGAVIPLPTPLRQPTANTAIYCANVTTGASTKVSAVGFKAP